MTRVRDLLGISAASLLRYGIKPDDEVLYAIEVLESRAPHVARLLRTVVGERAS
ncbi:hypothetical protein [Pyrobaculum ferrireducens]|jgi:hypothetical protein|uniref:PaREP10 n=1 Tax=Pyrobaculum ferrireducens TaxID=1104324 RepID=G7VEW3_9CREN|nr:hypothetical protein [Pyrobaculum ferrireducens]AET34128.1 hypothetical protein P186_2751 [Pyrobaculum ferrireducens]